MREFLIFVLLLYLLVGNIIGFVAGVAESNMGYRESACNGPFLRIYYVTPAFPLACWLMKPVGEK